MFPKIKTKLENTKYAGVQGPVYKRIIGSDLYEYLDELQNSKVFRNCEIEIVPEDTFGAMQSAQPIDRWTRFRGKIYLSFIQEYSISAFPGGYTNPNREFYICGNFNDCSVSHDEETAIKLDRLYELSKLDI